MGDVVAFRIRPRFARLPDPERLILWGMRVWVVGLQKRIPTDEVLYRAFGAAGVPGAVGLIDGLMAAIGHNARRTVAVECTCHAWVSDDERRLLDALARAHAGDEFGRDLLLDALVRPEALHAAGELTSRIARLMAEAGLPIGSPPRPGRGLSPIRTPDPPAPRHLH